MRAIIIEEERFTEICNLMKAEALATGNNGYLKQQTGLTKDQIQFAADEIHRAIHFHFVRWAQSHGASCTK